ncbi:MAG TPA: aldo/keto reductase [Polyangiaceae bacterium]|nr:aldo/keto reductase [Polyangiaceae bacterium]
MERRDLAFTEVRLPVIGQGTWNMENDDADEAVSTLRAGFDAGMTHLDTAELYGSGRVEERIVRRAIEGRRDELFLVSKVMPSNASRAGTIKACEQSLRRMGTDRLDLYLLHWPGSHPLEDTLAAFVELRKAGKIRFFGVSNFDASDLEEAVAIVGEGQIAVNQILYNLEERRIEHRAMPFCEAHGIAVVGYSPFGAGSFVSERSRGYGVLSAIAKARGATPRQVALRFLVRKKNLFAIPKASSLAHARDNAGAGAWELTPDEIRKIDEAFPRGPDRGGLPTN